MAGKGTTESRSNVPRIQRLRRGWVVRDDEGRGWWFHDTVVVAGVHWVVPAGHRSAQCRVFAPMVSAHRIARRVYRFGPGESRDVSLGAIERQLAAAISDPT
jgi:hypothetical protein